MIERDRRRRVVLLCISFARNLAYYQAGQCGPARALLCASHPKAVFWRQVNANFLDVGVLEWCKLFGDRKGEHDWRQVVSDPTKFEVDLLQHLGMDRATFEQEVKVIRTYRDKFVAHLDKCNVMDVPLFDTAKKVLWFYHHHVVAFEARPGDLVGLSADTTEKLTLGYKQCLQEAEELFTSSLRFSTKRDS